jgi:hypothetical protein
VLPPCGGFLNHVPRPRPVGACVGSRERPRDSSECWREGVRDSTELWRDSRRHSTELCRFRARPRVSSVRPIAPGMDLRREKAKTELKALQRAIFPQSHRNATLFNILCTGDQYYVLYTVLLIS